MIGRNGWLHGSEEMVKPRGITLPNPPLEVIRQYASSRPLLRLVPLIELEIDPVEPPKADGTDENPAAPEGQ